MKLASSWLFPNQWRLLASPQQLYLHFSTDSKSPTFWSPALRQCRNLLQTAVSPVVTSSYLPTSSYITQKQIVIPTSPEKEGPPVQESLGAFQKLPMVMPSIIDLYSSALRKSKRVQPTKGIANIAMRERNRGAKQLDEDRNNLEKLTLDVLTHLPTAVLYVHDLTGECGTSPSDQFGIYKEIKERFKDYLWIDVVSKCDLLGGSPVIYAKEDRSSDEAEIIKYRETGPDGSIHVSVKTEKGLSELKSRVKEVLSSEMEKIKSEVRVDPTVASS